MAPMGKLQYGKVYGKCTEEGNPHPDQRETIGAQKLERGHAQTEHHRARLCTSTGAAGSTLTALTLTTGHRAARRHALHAALAELYCR